MSPSLYQTLNISRQDMQSRMLNLDIISNNLSNMNTIGYKTSRGNFQELLTAATRDGSFLPATQVLHFQGAVKSSERALDWAINGDGFFQVQMPDGTIGYTRDGQFQLDAERNFVNNSGYALVWDGEIPEDTVEIALNPDGTMVATNATGQTQVIGQVELARFANPGGLLSHGENVFFVSENSGEAQVGAPGEENFGILKPYALEQANINLSEEMTNMITLQRAFQMSVRAFQQTDTMISQAIHLRKG